MSLELIGMPGAAPLPPLQAATASIAIGNADRIRIIA
jgi:hypothetical protein